VKADRKISIFVLIDALGWPCTEMHGFMADALPYRKALTTVLGYSSGAIPTILTGIPPAVHGHWNLLYFDPEGSPFRWLKHFQFLPDAVLDHRVTKKLLKELGRRVLGLGPLFECAVTPRLLPWFNWTERKSIYSPQGIETRATVFDHLVRNEIPHRVYTYHHLTDAEILAQAKRDLHQAQASFFFIYLSELDHVLHFHDFDSKEVQTQLAWYAKELNEIFDAAARSSRDVTFTACSDHGMTPVSNRFDLVREVEGLGFDMPNHYLSVYDSTMARFWFFHEQARDRVTALLNSLPCGRILPDEELDKLGILFPDGRYGELIFLLHPGWLLARSHFNGKEWNPIGMHGYHPEDPFSDAVFLSNRSPSTSLQTIADLYPLMAEAAGEVVHA
jgi:predicted AlkP superfamily pyrophosphatase or phosphodiesterase